VLAKAASGFAGWLFRCLTSHGYGGELMRACDLYLVIRRRLVFLELPGAGCDSGLIAYDIRWLLDLGACDFGFDQMAAYVHIFPPRRALGCCIYTLPYAYCCLLLSLRLKCLFMSDYEGRKVTAT